LVSSVDLFIILFRRNDSGLDVQCSPAADMHKALASLAIGAALLGALGRAALAALLQTGDLNGEASGAHVRGRVGSARTFAAAETANELAGQSEAEVKLLLRSCAVVQVLVNYPGVQDAREEGVRRGPSSETTKVSRVVVDHMPRFRPPAHRAAVSWIQLPIQHG
jgi:hypothetical protein